MVHPYLAKVVGGRRGDRSAGGGEFGFLLQGGKHFLLQEGGREGANRVFREKNIFKKKLNFNNRFEAYVGGFSPRTWGEISGD